MSYNTTILKGRGIRKEARAAGVVSPGDLVEFTSAGKYQRQSVDGMRVMRSFAVENELFGKGLDTDYADGDQLLVESCTPGMEVYATVAANAAAIAVGDRVVAAGDGTVKKWTTTEEPADLIADVGTPGTHTVDVTATPTQTTINNNFATVVAQLNKLTPGSSPDVGVAMEALDNSAIATKGRIRIELL